MGIPQILMIVIYGLKLGIALAKDGEPTNEKHSFILSAVGVAISVGILKAGGFF